MTAAKPLSTGQLYSTKQVDRFWSNVLILGEDDCWNWKLHRIPTGYGRVRFYRRYIYTHRFAWWITYGDPGEQFVLHKCDNPSCVNPNHLWLGSQADNMRDRDRKGRKYKRPKRPERPKKTTVPKMVVL